MFWHGLCIICGMESNKDKFKVHRLINFRSRFQVVPNCVVKDILLTFYGFQKDELLRHQIKVFISFCDRPYPLA